MEEERLDIWDCPQCGKSHEVNHIIIVNCSNCGTEIYRPTTITIFGVD